MLHLCWKVRRESAGPRGLGADLIGVKGYGATGPVLTGRWSAVRPAGRLFAPRDRIHHRRTAAQLVSTGAHGAEDRLTPAGCVRRGLSPTETHRFLAPSKQQQPITVTDGPARSGPVGELGKPAGGGN